MFSRSERNALFIMNSSCLSLRFLFESYYNLKILPRTVHMMTLHGYPGEANADRKHFFLRSYATDGNISKDADLQEKKRKFNELEINYQKLLNLEKLTPDEKRIHFLHAEAVERGHFTYDDPFLNEKVLTRLRHFLKGKCCGKSCRHCIYEHTGVVDAKKKAAARFNSSFWTYEGGLKEDLLDFDDEHVVTHGRGPYPRKYAQNATDNVIKIYSKPK